MDYSTANEKLGSRDSRKLGNNTYLQRRGEGVIAVRLHATDVLTYHSDGRTVYNSGGWRTLTTKERMNAYGPLRIFTERGVWYVGRPGQWDSRLVYADGLTVDADGKITGAGEAKDERGDKRAVKRFVAEYLGAFERGEVHAPDAGDCFICLAELDGDGHIRSHFEESYFVPTILSRALKMFGASQVCRQWVASYWDTSVPEVLRAPAQVGFYADHGRAEAGKMLRRYLLRQLGYAV